jgi:dipeptidyl aminopeptidase/acylaminoacyl peptidase
VTFRFVVPRKYLYLALALCATPHFLEAEIKHLLTPEACTEIRYLAQDHLTDRLPLQLSPDGNTAAYILQVPDIASNDNKDELFVTLLTPHRAEPAKLLLINELIAAIQWFPDNRHLAVLMRQKGRMVLVEIDSVTRRQDLIWKADSDITDYSMDATADMIAVAVKLEEHDPSPSRKPRNSPQGYRLDIASTTHSEQARRQVYVLHLAHHRRWEIGQLLRFVSPLSGKTFDSIYYNHDLHINLSPDGHYLLADNVEAFSDVTPQSSWSQSRLVEYMKTAGSVGLLVSYLYDLHTNRTTMPLTSPLVRTGVWAPDSRSYVKVALAPAASSWEASDLASGAPNAHITHMFNVDVLTGKVSEILERAEDSPVAWTKTGDIIVRNSAGTLLTLRRTSDNWRQIATIPLPLSDGARYSPLASDGRRVLMEYENASTAPQLLAFDLPAGHTWTVAKLNPQVDSLTLPKTRVMTWTTSTGFTAKGLLLLPPDYDPQRRYPLVIEDGSVLYSDEFVCDSGTAHVPSFVRGILADAGIVYLMRYWPGINNWETNYYPKGYPGGVVEAAFKQDLVESAVRLLDQHQIIDPTKVGLIGFSRGGWYVEYTLTHSRIVFQAATATDNVLYSMGEYWFWNNEAMARSEEDVYGGPPYGKSLKNWLDYSISFNLDKIRTPLLMEVMGYGKKYEDADQPPDNLAVHNEIFVGLSRLNKAVEYYYYPDEQHQPDHPQARIASLRRNVDWYRFWLQGYERAGPEDPDQYRRWEHLRELRDGDLKDRQFGANSTGQN